MLDPKMIQLAAALLEKEGEGRAAKIAEAKDQTSNTLSNVASVAGSTMLAGANNPDNIADPGQGAMGGAIQGAANGMSGGPLGMLSGALLGGLSGLITTGYNREDQENKLYEDQENMILGNQVNPQVMYAEEGGPAKSIDPDGVTAAQMNKGEAIMFGDLSVVDSKSKQEHSEMDPEDVTDLLPSDAYAFSNNEKYMLDPNNIDDEFDVLGYMPVVYSETSSNTLKETDKIRLSDVLGTKELTFADAVNKIKRKFPVTDRKDDMFAMQANDKNKEARLPYIQKLITLQEMATGRLERRAEEELADADPAKEQIASGQGKENLGLVDNSKPPVGKEAVVEAFNKMSVVEKDVENIEGGENRAEQEAMDKEAGVPQFSEGGVISNPISRTRDEVRAALDDVEIDDNFTGEKKINGYTFRFKKGKLVSQGNRPAVSGNGVKMWYDESGKDLKRVQYKTPSGGNYNWTNPKTKNSGPNVKYTMANGSKIEMHVDEAGTPIETATISSPNNEVRKLYFENGKVVRDGDTNIEDGAEFKNFSDVIGRFNSSDNLEDIVNREFTNFQTERQDRLEQEGAPTDVVYNRQAARQEFRGGMDDSRRAVESSQDIDPIVRVLEQSNYSPGPGGNLVDDQTGITLTEDETRSVLSEMGLDPTSAQNLLSDTYSELERRTQFNEENKAEQTARRERLFNKLRGNSVKGLANTLATTGAQSIYEDPGTIGSADLDSMFVDVPEESIRRQISDSRRNQFSSALQMLDRGVNRSRSAAVLGAVAARAEETTSRLRSQYLLDRTQNMRNRETTRQARIDGDIMKRAKQSNTMRDSANTKLKGIGDSVNNYLTRDSGLRASEEAYQNAIESEYNTNRSTNFQNRFNTDSSKIRLESILGRAEERMSQYEDQNEARANNIGSNEVIGNPSDGLLESLNIGPDTNSSLDPRLIDEDNTNRGAGLRFRNPNKGTWRKSVREIFGK